MQNVNVEWINRIFRKEAFCYEGRIHEQIISKDKTVYDTYQAPITIGHTGYNLSEEEREAKGISKGREEEIAASEIVYGGKGSGK